FPGSSLPSVFGALPFTGPSTQPAVLAFTFVFNPTIMNSIVTGPDDQPYYRISTDNPTPGFTFIHNTQGRPIVVIEWQAHPVVEVRDIIPKQLASQWLELSSQRNYSSRHMEVRGKRYVWTPGDGSIILLNPATNPPERMGRLFNGQHRATLELTSYAIHAGLTEVAIVSAFLLICGRNI
ncbi:hypothetical protein PLEOSDRAFT_1030439, partial [Pleurotus ostreatus PC15]